MDCIVEGCSKPGKTDGLCYMHYKRFRKAEREVVQPKSDVEIENMTPEEFEREFVGFEMVTSGKYFEPPEDCREGIAVQIANPSDIRCGTMPLMEEIRYTCPNCNGTLTGEDGEECDWCEGGVVYDLIPESPTHLQN